MTRWQKLALATLLTLILVGMLYSFVAGLPFWDVKNIIVIDNQNIPEKKIIAACELDKIGLLKISAHKINHNVCKKIDQIKEVAVKKKFPDTLILQVKLRQPIVKVFLQNSTEYFDEEAVVITDYPHNKNIALLVDIPIDREKLREKIIRNADVLTMISNLSPSQNIAIYQLGDQLRFNIGDTAIKCGSLKGYQNKLEYLKILIDNIDLQHLEYIDLRALKNIAVRRQ